MVCSERNVSLCTWLCQVSFVLLVLLIAAILTFLSFLFLFEARPRPWPLYLVGTTIPLAVRHPFSKPFLFGQAEMNSLSSQVAVLSFYLLSLFLLLSLLLSRPVFKYCG